MKLQQKQLVELLDLASKTAREAGAIIQSYRGKDIEVFLKEGGSSEASQVLTQADTESQALIFQSLKDSCYKYDIGWLAEESKDNGSRFSKDYFWSVDPLDGTLPFSESQQGYSVSIALVSKKGIPQLGVIYDPWNGILYEGLHQDGARRNAFSWLPQETQKDSFYWIMDRSLLTDRRYTLVRSVLEECIKQWGYKQLIPLSQAGAALNACWTGEKAPACYLKLPQRRDGGGSLWDFAASACIMQEAGLWVSDIHGAPLELNRKKSLFMGHRGVLYINPKHLGQRLIKALTSLSEAI